MTELYRKISENFKINYDIESVINNTGPDLRNPDKQWVPYSDKTGIPHWQMFDAGIAFSRNFYKNFKPFCTEVAKELQNVQNLLLNIENDSILLQSFLNHSIDEKLVNLIRVPAGNNVKPHVDRTRDICINIGLKNTNVCKTHIIDSFETTDFWNNSTRETFHMQDGDVYLISVKHAHAVESLINSNSDLTRYIITYNMILR